MPFLALLSFLVAAAGQDPAPKPPPPDPMARFAPLLGTDWVAAFPGGKVTDTQRFEAVYGGKFVRSRHWVRTGDGKTVYEGETMYAFDHRAGRIVWWYWNVTGGHVTGTLLPQPDGSWLVEGENHGPKDQKDKVRQVIRLGERQWTVTPHKEQEGRWVEDTPRTYRPTS